MAEFKNRVFGCVIVKAINANYNADFTHQPRTLPDGIVYATDKAFKYSVRHYLKNQLGERNVFFYKELNEKLNPLSLDEKYIYLFGEHPKMTIEKKKKGDTEKEEKKEVLDKKAILQKLLQCIDIRLFGATYAGETNISIHGPVQINHGINRFPNNEIYSEQIMSPFRNPGEKESEEKGMTTLGQQSKLREGHYVHHFSVNPKNIASSCKLAGVTEGLTTDDIRKLKEAMRCGVTYYDSASKAGTDNELLLWIQLKPESNTVLPVFTEFVDVTRENGNVMIDFKKLNPVIVSVFDQIELMEVYYNPENTKVHNLPEQVKKYNIITTKEIV